MSGEKKGKKSALRILKFIILPIILYFVLNIRASMAWFAFFLIIEIIKIKRRKYLMKDREGKPVKTKEFFKRWKEGIEGITPLQQAKTSLMGNWIVLSGIVAGMVINVLVRMKDQWWWIEIILAGSLVLVVIQMISGFQKYWRIKEVDKQMKELEQ